MSKFLPIQSSRRGFFGLVAGLSAVGAGLVATPPVKAAPSISAADAEIYEMIRKVKEAERILAEVRDADTSGFEAVLKKRLAAWKRMKWRESGLRASEHERPWTLREELDARNQISAEIGYNTHCSRWIDLDKEYLDALIGLNDAPQADTLAAVDALAAAMTDAPYHCNGGEKTLVRQLRNLAGKAVA